jgi:hypothetical protein
MLYQKIPGLYYRAERQAVPTSAADLTATDTYIQSLVIANVGATALTITIKDRQGTPRNLLAAVSIAGNQTVTLTFEEPEKMKGGINWVASGAGLEASLTGSKMS